jgi:hypothetical protein
MRNAGWFFSVERAFDLAVALSLDYPPRNDPRPQMREALLANFNFEAGCNPNNVSFLTGTGWKRPREIVHQYAQNDRRVLPPSGIPIGDLQQGFGWIDVYKQELGALCYPLDGAGEKPYPLYDRWGDSFNLSTEFVIVDQARALATACWWMGQTAVATQPYRMIPGTIITTTSRNLPATQPQFTLVFKSNENVEGLAPRVIWEIQDEEPSITPALRWIPRKPGSAWIEVEAFWPDGRRSFATTNLLVETSTKTSQILSR